MSPTPSGRSGLAARLRASLGLLLVGLLALSLIAWSNRVEVNVDGEIHSLRTYDATVAEVLERLDVVLDPGDVINVDVYAPLHEGMSIAIDRAVTVDIVVDGVFTYRVVAPIDSVAGALEHAGLTEVRDDGAEIVPGWTSPVSDGDIIKVWTPQDITLSVDGKQLQLASLVYDVDTLLTKHGIELGPYDTINVRTDAPLVFISDVTIERVEYVEEVEEIALEFAEERRETSDLNRGTTRVQHEGREGVREDTYLVTLVDGEEVDRELISEEVVREPESRVVLVGTYVPPPPPPPTSTSSGSSSSRTAPSGVPAADDPVWERLAQCESNGNWSLVHHATSSITYYGGLQFHADTWRTVGGSGLPHEASRAEQIYRAQVLLSKPWATWGNQWPACSRMLGLS
jgi:resuscitation-promoting factor RpfB